MAAIPQGRYTRQQIRDLALKAARNTKLDADAKSWLAQILFDLYTLYDWPFLLVSQALTLTGPTFPLPTDFLQSQDDKALVTSTMDGQVFVTRLHERDRQDFEALNTIGATGPPNLWTADRAAGLGLLAPNPTGHTIAASLRYKRQPPEPLDAVEPADVPVFPWHDYLVQAVFVQALRHENDPRLAQERQVRDDMLALIRRGAKPVRSGRPVVDLDERVFGMPFRGDLGGRRGFGGW